MEEGEARATEMDDDLRKRIKKTVKKILKRSSLYEMTEIKARAEASSELHLDLSEDPYKLVVREAVESFIEEAIATIENHKVKSQNQRQGGGGEEEDEEESEKQKTKNRKKEKKKKKKKKTKEELDS